MVLILVRRIIGEVRDAAESKGLRYFKLEPDYRVDPLCVPATRSAPFSLMA
jgi:hypothetical protein